jgi:hypothetical protein
LASSEGEKAAARLAMLVYLRDVEDRDRPIASIREGAAV